MEQVAFACRLFIPLAIVTAGRRMIKIGVKVQILTQLGAFAGVKGVSSDGEMGWNIDVPIPRFQGIHAEC